MKSRKTLFEIKSINQNFQCVYVNWRFWYM